VSLLLGPRLRRVLDGLGAEGEPLALGELARRLFALRSAPEPPLARRLLASALGCEDRRLPDLVEVRALPCLLEGDAAEVALADAAWIAVDLETTGLSAERCEILEIGAVRIVDLRCADRFETLVEPGGTIPPFITALTGIDRRATRDAPSIASAIRAFRSWVGSEPVAFVAHNAGFDARFVRRAFERHGVAAWRGPVFCTRQLARRLLPELGRYDLDALCARFGIANRDRHRALGDAVAAARALLELVEVARSAHRLHTLGDLLALQAAPARRRRRRVPRASSEPSGAPKP